MDQNSAESIPTNLRLILILEAIAKAGTPVTPTEVNRQLGLPKPSIHRLFATLEAEGFIERDIDGRHYSPARRSRVMAASILSSERLRTARFAILARVADRMGETCNIALPDRDAMIYLERAETKWPLRIQLPVGTKVPLYCTASGKMYLSSLSDKVLSGYVRSSRLDPKTPNTIINGDDLIDEIRIIRQRGYSIDREEFMLDMVAVSVPVLDKDQRLVATLSTHAPKQRLSLATDLETIIAELSAGASELAKLIIE